MSRVYRHQAFLTTFSERALSSEAERRHRQAEKINRALGDGYRLAQTQLNLAQIYACGAKNDQAARHKAETILALLAQNQAWPRGRCIALQNMAKLQHDLGDPSQARELYQQAWRLYKQMVPDSARDIAFEEWTLLGWWEVAESDASRRELYALASDVLGRMRGNLRRVLFRRNYGVRVSKLIERGLPFAGGPEDQATELGKWSAQEISDLPDLLSAIDEFIAGVDFGACDETVRTSVRNMKGSPEKQGTAGGTAGTQRINSSSWKYFGGPLQQRHVQYLRHIEHSRLHVPVLSTPWDVHRLQDCLAKDTAVAAYFWPREWGEEKFVSVPRVYVISKEQVRMRTLPVPANFAKSYKAKAAPEDGLRTSMFAVLVQPIFDVIEALGIRSLYLIPYGSLFGLPIHCAQQSLSAPLLCNDPRFDRVLYSASPRQLTWTLESKKFGSYGDMVNACGRGLAVIDPAEDLGEAYKPVQATMQGMASQGRAVVQIGAEATYEALLSDLASATWWAYAGHGYLPTDSDLVNRNKPEEAKIGAVLELADGVVEDLDLLLRSGARSLQFCILSACVSAGLNVSEGNELAGFVRALKARGCGPVVVAFWEVPKARAAPVLNGLLTRIRDASGDLQGFTSLRETIEDLARHGERKMSADVVYSGMFGVYV